MPNSRKISKVKSGRILGIDPGYERLGIALIEKAGGKDRLVHSECFKTPSSLSFSKRLKEIGDRVEKIIEEFKPSSLAIENLFVSTNQKTAMRVGEVRGALLYLAERAGLPIYEYTPLQVKIAVSGYGKSDKRQVEMMVRRLILIEKEIKDDDEIDAIAIALTASASIR
jgi:crossover junction endodeoxyribonuclease RuvC